jgi:hypothetical protein
MTEAIYEEVSAKTEKATVQHRRISVCGMLKYLDVSRSGYRFLTSIMDLFSRKIIA